MRPALTVTAAALLALTAALPAAAQPADGGDCADGTASPALAVIELAPDDVIPNQTRSRNPYVLFEFPCAVKAELTALTLDGKDVLEHAVRINDREYALVASWLELGWRTLVYSARDGAGNTVEDARFVFRVLERKPYRVSLEPGWNLISFPWYPRDHRLEHVIGPDKKASVVMAYRYGKWAMAVRGENGWQGELTEILSGYGYWVYTTAAEDLEVVLGASSSSDHYPVIPVKRGWNLLGVQDVRGLPEGAPGSTFSVSVDSCFYGMPWRVAYGFSTSLNEWDAPLLPNAQPPAQVENGRGYWVWSETRGSALCWW